MLVTFWIRARNSNNLFVEFVIMYPLLPSTTKHSIKIATQLKKPRYVIFGLMTDKKNIMTAYKLYLNSEFYLYDDLNLDKHRIAILYDMYLRFRTFYYQIPRERNKSSFQLHSFLKGYTLVTIDCSRQNECVKRHCGCMIRI